MIVTQFQDLGIDETLNQTENIGIGAALDLAHEPLFSSRQGCELVGQRESVRQEFLCRIERPPTNDIRVDIPPNALGGLNATCIPIGGRELLDRIHVASPLTMCRAGPLRETTRQ